jgi:hypothetical protein
MKCGRALRDAHISELRYGAPGFVLVREYEGGW